MKVIVFMTLRNISKKENLFKEVYKSASKISNTFYIVNHGSEDNTIEILNVLSKEYGVINIINNEKFIGTMDDMKAKHYKIIKSNYPGNYILALDWDEILSDQLIVEINNLDFKNDVYFIKRNTYFLGKIVVKNELLPIFFKNTCVEISNFKSIHDLYRVKSNNTYILKNELLHYSYENVDELYEKTKMYSKIEAQQLYKKNKSIPTIKIIVSMLLESFYISFRKLIIEGNIKNIEGILYSIHIFSISILKFMYYIEIKNNNL